MLPTKGLAAIAVASLTACAALPLACTSSNNPTPGASSDDAGSPVTCAAGTAILCVPETDGSVPIDGTLPEADGETPGDDSSATPQDGGAEAAPLGSAITVTVTSVLGSEQGVTVVFSDEAGAVLGSQVTNAQGIASEAVPANCQVTVLLGTAFVPQNVTIQGAQPGDALSVYDPTKLAPDAGSDWVQITSVPSEAIPAASEIQFFSSTACDVGVSNQGFPPSTAYQLTAGCQSGGTFPVLVLASTNEFAASEIGYAFVKGNAIVPDTANNAAQVSTSAQTWITPVTQTFSLTNPVAGTRASLTYDEVAGGVSYAKSLPSQSLQQDGGPPETYSFFSHPSYPDFTQSEVLVSQTSNPNGAGLQAVAVRTDAPTDAGVSAFDLSQMIPFLNAPTLDTSVTGRPTAHWSATAALPAVAEGAVVTFTWGNGEVEGTWTLVTPSSATSAQAPALPSTSAAWAPGAADAGTDFTGPTAVIAGGTAIPTYAQFRAVYPQVPVGSRFISGVLPLLPRLAANGTLFATGHP